MTSYIGVKLIDAKPMTRGEHSISKGYETVLEGSPSDAGYQVIYPDGYESWSPKDVFEEAYRPTDGLTFGLAIEALKKGYRVARTGWNGKNMWLTIQFGVFYPENLPEEFDPESSEPFDQFISMYTANSTFIPWLASQADMLAKDYYIID